MALFVGGKKKAAEPVEEQHCAAGDKNEDNVNAQSCSYFGISDGNAVGS